MDKRWNYFHQNERRECQQYLHPTPAAWLRLAEDLKLSFICIHLIDSLEIVTLDILAVL